MQTAREAGLRDLEVARHIVPVMDLPLLGSGKTDYVTLQSIDLLEAAANEPALADGASPARGPWAQPGRTANPSR
jgi:hypothetical protein